MGFYVLLRVVMNSYGLLWVPIGANGFLWVIIGTVGVKVRDVDSTFATQTLHLLLLVLHSLLETVTFAT